VDASLRAALAGFRPAFPPGLPGDPGLFGPRSVSWRVNGEIAVLVAGQRALLMQVAHPLVAAGVAHHSDFRSDPYQRLWRTVGAMLAITFADAPSARAAAEGVNRVHRQVRGLAGDGTPYDALDPDLLLWVHATLVDGGLLAYERFVAPLTPAARERYHREMLVLARLLGLPTDLVPPTVPDLRAYLAATAEGLDVTDEARSIARDVLRPPVPAVLRPVVATLRLVTIELLPSPLRERFGLRIGQAGEMTVRALAAASRAALPLVPARWRRWPQARIASRRVAGDPESSRPAKR
jgi:uncharacterized protein (DUF2236 family)